MILIKSQKKIVLITLVKSINLQSVLLEMLLSCLKDMLKAELSIFSAKIIQKSYLNFWQMQFIPYTRDKENKKKAGIKVKL